MYYCETCNMNVDDICDYCNQCEECCKDSNCTEPKTGQEFLGDKNE